MCKRTKPAETKAWFRGLCHLSINQIYSIQGTHRAKCEQCQSNSGAVFAVYMCRQQVPIAMQPNVEQATAALSRQRQDC